MMTMPFPTPQPLRLALAPGERRTLDESYGAGTIVVTQGRGRLTGFGGGHDLLDEGDVGTIEAGAFVIANACAERDLRVIIFR